MSRLMNKLMTAVLGAGIVYATAPHVFACGGLGGFRGGYSAPSYSYAPTYYAAQQPTLVGVQVNNTVPPTVQRLNTAVPGQTQVTGAASVPPDGQFSTFNPQSIGQPNGGQQNFAARTAGQQNFGQQNVGQQNVGQQNFGQQNVGQQNVAPTQNVNPQFNGNNGQTPALSNGQAGFNAGTTGAVNNNPNGANANAIGGNPNGAAPRSPAVRQTGLQTPVNNNVAPQANVAPNGNSAAANTGRANNPVNDGMNNAQQTALQALGGADQAASASSNGSGLPVGEWTAKVSNDASIKLTLNENGSFSWNAVNKGKSSSFEGNYSIQNGALTLTRSTDNQKLSGGFTQTQDGFTFKMKDAKDNGLNFSRG